MTFKIKDRYIESTTTHLDQFHLVDISTNKSYNPIDGERKRLFSTINR